MDTLIKGSWSINWKTNEGLREEIMKPNFPPEQRGEGLLWQKIVYDVGQVSTGCFCLIDFLCPKEEFRA